MKRTATGPLSVLLGAVLALGACFPSACASTGGLNRSNNDSPGAAGLATAVLAAPEGFLAMEVIGVLPTSEGHAVFLADADETLVLPIWIGPTEAMAIQLRLERRRFERPLTHDLLDSLVHELGGEVVKVQVDGLKGDTFVGTVYLRNGKKDLVEFDARPSDAIALAVGNRAPIFVAKAVLDEAALTREELEAEAARQDELDPDLETEEEPGFHEGPGFPSSPTDQLPEGQPLQNPSDPTEILTPPRTHNA